MSVVIKGTVQRILFSNKETDYYVFNLQTDDGIVGANITFPNITVGLNAEFHGEWTNHPKYGDQFKAQYAVERLPESKVGFKNYLMSGVFKGIGSATADKILDFLGENPLDVFKNDIDKILQVPKVPLKKLQAIKDSWLSNTETNDIVIFLRQYGITTASVKKIYAFYGSKTIATIKKNPYILIKHIDGIGFKNADKIALKMGIPKDSPDRMKEGIKYVLEQSVATGHCYLLKNQLIEQCNDLLEIDLTKELDEMLQDFESLGIKKLTLNEEDRFYANSVYNAEQKCLEVITQLLRKEEKEFDYGLLNNITLSDEQNAAVVGALSDSISILTGGPGCGKTFSTKTVVNTLLEAKKRIVICAPTGKAAQRSREVIGYDNTLTIHRLLKYSYELKGFEHNEDNPLPYDYIIVEESSMINVVLMASLLRAVNCDCQILFVGDHNQLPPIDAGCPFKDMIDSKVIPTYKLTKIFRQGKDSDIINFAHEINHGDYPQIPSPLKEPKLWQQKNDCMFIDSGNLDPYMKPNQYANHISMHYGMGMIDMVIKLYLDTIKKYHEITDIQILIPKRVGDNGTTVINQRIQDVVNPITSDEEQIIVGDKRFRNGDKVIHVVNNYQLGDGVFNGEIGSITSINKKDATCTVQFDTREIKYARKDMFDLELAYAITIHKSQGSEFGAVIMPLMNEYGMMLERSLVYTGLTRAKKLAIFVGERQALLKSVRNVNSGKRQTSLCELLVKENNLAQKLVY